MIDKKQFRVENETVKNWATTTYDVPEGASIQDVCFSSAFIAANEMAADLLDAREVIDKQEAIIKEMRSDIIALAGTYRDGFIEEYCETILEKTKDYA